MSITVNGQSCVPPGFRFHPTEEELLNYYLRKKLVGQNIDLDVIRDVDLNKLEPWDIQEKCKIGSTPQNDWYFFSHKDKKYPTGTRTNRATAAGFWKATGRDKVIYTGCKRIGMRKTLVFYKGRAPHGQKSDWIMHEYRLDESNTLSNVQVANTLGEANNQEDGWVVCRVFKKKNLLHKSSDSPNNNTPSITVDAKTHFLLHSQSDGALDQILQYMGRSCKQERFMKLPALESPAIPPMTEEFSNKSSYSSEDIRSVVNTDTGSHMETGMTDWTALDRLVASHLNGQSDASKQLYNCFDDPTFTLYNNNGGGGGGGSNNDDGDLWSLASSASDPISHVSHTSI